MQRHAMLLARVHGTYLLPPPIFLPWSKTKVLGGCSELLDALTNDVVELSSGLRVPVENQITPMREAGRQRVPSYEVEKKKVSDRRVKINLQLCLGNPTDVDFGQGKLISLINLLIIIADTLISY